MPSNASLGTFGGMLDDLKSRLGFERDEGRYEPDDTDDFEGYDEYSYDEYGDFDEEDSVGGFKPIQARSSRYGYGESSPNLVSIGDVKATTPLPSLHDDGAVQGDGGMQQKSVGGHYVIDATAPAPSSPAYRAAQRDAQSRFEASIPTIEPTPSPTYDYASAVGTRALTVVRPMKYGDVEGVAKALKSGDAVVLVMRSAPDELSKRILDFCFGVASALEARVECPGERVFVIARGNALTESEKRRLRAQAII